MNGFFVVGTDTGVGKTLVTTALARALRAQGLAVRVCKPVATGASRVEGRWLAEDTRLLAEAIGAGPEEHDAITPWVFPEPAAPPVAARAAGISLSLTDLANAVRRQAARGQVILVEGVGGLLCPLTEQETVADLAVMLGLPVLVVARRSLGTLNHTLLTIESARRRGLPLVGLVVSETEPVEGLAARTNVEELRRRIDIPLLAVVPHQAPDALAALDWRPLLHRINPEGPARHVERDLPLRPL